MTDGDSDVHEPASPLARRIPFPEAAALFNGPLGSIILTAAALGHVEDVGRGLPWHGAFLVMPFTLHDPTRLSLPRDVRSSMASWLSQHPVLADQFDGHAHRLAPVTRRAIRYAMRSRMLNLDSGMLVPAGPIRGASGVRAAQVRPYIAAGRLTGRWLAKTDVLTAYSILKVRL